VHTVVRYESGEVAIDCNGNERQVFDHVIMACHSDQALKILGSAATPIETEILSAFPYHTNEAILHTQHDVLPRTRRAWACWNYFNPREPHSAATVTYNMNILQSLDCEKTYCVTLNDNGRIRPENIIRTINYAHPTFDSRRKQMQDRHDELVNHHGISYCGAYWRNGFHEDGVVSALNVVDQIAEVPQYV
ncbi:MAG: FAD-dependent oxidoreductase, partial [Planctomycetota bacterium]